MQSGTTEWTFGEIRSLLREFDSAGIEELIFTEGDKSIALRRTYGSGQLLYPGAARDGGEAGKELSAAERADLPGTQGDISDQEPKEREETVIPAQASGQAEVSDEVLPSDSAAGHEDHIVSAPFAGVFYRAAEPGGTPYTAAGTEVKEGDVLGLLEAMKMMNEITAPCGGIIEEICKEDGGFCAYDEPLFRIRRSADV